ncbi:hypothetical protein SUSP_001160 [Sulfurospirillum sp. 'SP']|nr:hypothetical protein [Sulfurospirillum sp. 'SP']WNY98742.1 hypothetical protein SUSP_001160 [Sulfurospirillum sp. 'SP']
MAVKTLGENSAQEFVETFIYGVGYNEGREQIQEFTKDVSNPILQDAIQSSMNVLIFGAIMYAVQKQEALISKLFDAAEVLLLALVGKVNKYANKLKGKKGTKLHRFISFLQGSNQENLMTAQVIATHVGSKNMAHSTNGNVSGAVGAYQMQLDTKNSLYQREQLHMDLANNMTSGYRETLMFKLFTKSFTPNDELILKKILGRDSVSTLNVADINKISDFMFVKDSNGNLIGLAETMYRLLNGLGYLNKK